MQKYHPKVVNPRDIAGERKKKTKPQNNKKTSHMKAIQPPFLTSIQGPCLTPVKMLTGRMFGRLEPWFYSKCIFFSCSFHKFFNAAVAFPVLFVNSSQKDRADVTVDPK